MWSKDAGKGMFLKLKVQEALHLQNHEYVF